MADRTATCSFCDKEARVVAGASGAVICVDCASLAVHLFAQEGVVPEPATFVGTITPQELDAIEKADSASSIDGGDDDP